MSEVKLKVLRGTIIEKKPAKIGQVVSVSKKDADYLIRTQKAELFKEEEAKTVVESEKLETSEEAVAEAPAVKTEKPKGKNKK
jgi:hypothetical protein